MTRQQQIQRAYTKVANHYLKVATLQNEVGRRLFERLSYLKINPQTILDLGCGPGNFLGKFRQTYPRAHIIGLDLTQAMVRNYKPPIFMRNKPQLIIGDMESLPLSNNSVDMIFANQVVHWANDTAKLFQELNRVLRPEGVVVFSTMGPDTCRELVEAWAPIDNYQHVNQFKDMHDLGDELLANRFAEPVVDMEYLTVKYANPQQMLKDLQQQGVKNLNPLRSPALTGKNSLKKLIAALAKQDELLLTYEVIYGQAWKAQPKSSEVRISIDKIGRVQR